MILFELYIEDTFIGSCSTDCTSDVSHRCSCVCDRRFHNTPTAEAVHKLLANPETLVTWLASMNPGKRVRIEVDEHELLDYLMANAKLRSLTRIRGVDQA